MNVMNAPEPMHFGRTFHGTRLEDDCPCPKAACGLVDNIGLPGCEQHGLKAGRTIRQMHRAAACPGAS